MDRYQSKGIAVVGMACHFPGATDLDEFWALLKQGRRAISPLVQDRWNNAALFDAKPGTPGKLATQAAGLIDHFDRYDYGFLGLSNVEAQSTDPQQLLVLETAWRALEDANIPPSILAGTRAGVFIGASSNDFEAMQTTRKDTLTAHSGMPSKNWRCPLLADFCVIRRAETNPKQTSVVEKAICNSWELKREQGLKWRCQRFIKTASSPKTG